MAECPDPVKSDGTKKMEQQLKELKIEFERVREELGASNAENASLKEQVKKLQDGNVGETTRFREEKGKLVAAIESKEKSNADLRAKLSRLQSDLKRERKRCRERETMESSEVERLEKKCSELVLQITGLIYQQQESDAEINSLRQRIIQLEEENERFTICGTLFSLD